jgi:hypothetical protein
VLAAPAWSAGSETRIRLRPSLFGSHSRRQLFANGKRQLKNRLAVPIMTPGSLEIGAVGSVVSLLPTTPCYSAPLARVGLFPHSRRQLLANAAIDPITYRDAHLLPLRGDF